MGALTTFLAMHAYDLLHSFFTGEDKINNELWIAKEKVQAYPAPFGKHILFEINEGDTCTPIKTLITKERMQVNILCKNGQGWIIGRIKQFDIIKAKEQSPQNPTKP